MKDLHLLIIIPAILILLLTGCGPDPRLAKVEPQSELDYERDADLGNSPYNRDGEQLQRIEDLAADDLNLITIHFDYDKFQLNSTARDLMAENAVQLTDHPRSVILIEGHCDERGTEEYNLALGEKRAREVREYLIKYGINSDRISIISYGESMPAEFEHNENAWAKNRRAEFAVLSK